MLRSTHGLRGYTISAADGNVGTSHDFLFDDQDWKIRYLVVDTGNWLPGRKVLIATSALGTPNFVGKMFPVDLTREAIEKSPPLRTDMPVSRQYEIDLSAYYGWAVAHLEPLVHQVEEGDPHLRSCKEVIGYRVESEDGRAGHVEDFIVDDQTWALRYLVVDTKKWLPGRKVLVSHRWAEEISWTSRLVKIDLSREAILESPEFDPSAPVNREYEERLYDFYGRPQYWTETVTKV